MKRTNTLSMADEPRVFQEIGLPVFVLNTQHEILMVNPAAEKLLKSSQPEVQGKKCYALLHGSKVPPDGCPLKKVLASGQLETVEMEVEAVGGTYLVSCTPVAGEDGKIEKIIHICTDITEKKRTAETLQEKEYIIESATSVIATADLDGMMTYVNPAFLRTWGFESASEVLGNHFSEYWMVKERLDEIMRSLLEDMSWFDAIKGRKKDGTLFDVQVHASPVLDANGTPVALMSSSVDITAQKQAEETIKKSEAKLRQIIDLVPHFIFAKDKSGRFILANQAVAETYGTTVENLTGKTDADFNPDHNEVEHFLKHDLEVIESGKRKDIPEERITDSEGNVRILYTIKIPFTLSLSDDDAVLGVSTDITELKRTENALRESELRYRKLLQAIPVGVVVHHSDTSISGSNKAAEQLLGLSKEQLAGKAAADRSWNFYREDGTNLPVEEHPVNQVLVSRESLRDFVIGVRRSDKDAMLWVLVNADPIKEGKGELSAIVVSFMDITDRKIAQEALRESEEKYRTVLEGSPDPVVVYDMKGKVLFVNSAFTHIFGWSLEEIFRKKMDYVPEEEIPVTHTMIDKVKRGKGFSNYETRRKTKDGKILDISLSAAVYQDQGGRPAGSIITLRDVSERKRLRARLEQARRLESIATMAGGIAHQFNNALSAIMGNIELLKMDMPENYIANKYADQMKESSYRMAHLTEQLLAYARGGQYRPQVIRINDLVKDTLSILQHTFDAAIDVETDLPKNTWNILADTTQMQMVLSAILSNAAEAVEGDGRIRIICRNEERAEVCEKERSGMPSGSYVHLAVEDDGKGMDEEIRRRAFEPFFTTKFQGRGLGLAAAYGIVKNHDGWIFIDSMPGKGTTVDIYFPPVTEDKEAAEIPKIEMDKLSGTVLIVEDEEAVLDVSRAFLKRLGCNVFLARTGTEAIKIVKEFKQNIDVALLDVVLPDMGGDKVYFELMKIHPDLKVIVCSGYSLDGPAQEILSAGAEEFIQKPVSIKTLARKLRKVLPT